MSVRILHLLSADADSQAWRTHELLQREAGADFCIERHVLRAGLRASSGDWREMRRRVAGNGSPERPQLVHAFGTAALATASLAGHRRILFTPMPGMPVRSVRWLRAAMSYCDVQVACGSATQHRQMVTRGVPSEQCHAIRPAVEFSRIRGRYRDPELRARLGIAASDVVLLAIGESTRAAAHDLAVWSCGILNVLDARHRIVLWGRGAELASPVTLARRLNQEAMAVDASRVLGRCVDFEELLPAADAAVLTARGSVATLPIAQAMAAALPIVAVTTRLTTELLEDRHNALLVASPIPRLLAQRALDVLEDAKLAWSLGEMARTEAFEYFSPSRMLEAYRTVYRQMAAGERVAVPAAPAGAGLRFHGRG